jgi:hypothetical protein
LDQPEVGHRIERIKFNGLASLLQSNVMAAKKSAE